MKRSLIFVCSILFLEPSFAEQCVDAKPCVFTEERAHEFVIFARNPEPFDITIGLELELTNLRIAMGAENTSSTQFVVPANSQQELLSLALEDKNKNSQVGLAYSWLPGDVFAVHDETVLYTLPYTVGKSFYVSQTCNGGKSHHSTGSQYAIDFAMPIGTPVHAARGGTVVNLQEVSISGGTSTMNYDEGNFVQLRHADGTVASYHHLRTMGVKVEIGDVVKQGDFIAYSGNTGFTSGPHLHFVVQKPATVRSTKSFPLKWKTSRGVLSCPRRGLALKSVAP